jgi:hypothetical protein
MARGQLHLFKGARQRGTALPPAPEFSLHCMVADVLKRWCVPDWRYTHFPAGEERPGRFDSKGKRFSDAGNRLKRMGVIRGWPDFQFLHVKGLAAFLELKRRGEWPSDEQQELAFFLMRAGHGYLITDRFDDALDALRAWRIVPSGINTG